MDLCSYGAGLCSFVAVLLWSFAAAELWNLAVYLREGGGFV